MKRIDYLKNKFKKMKILRITYFNIFMRQFNFDKFDRNIFEARCNEFDNVFSLQLESILKEYKMLKKIDNCS